VIKLNLVFNNSTANAQSLTFVPNSPVKDGFIKIHSSGKLAAKGGDQRLLIRVNGANTAYRSFVHMGGDAGLGEWDDRGFYIGRNGWSLDAAFSLEFTLAVNSSSQKIVGSGSSVFALGDNRILGYESHGFFVTNQPISQIQILFTGGVADWQSRFYQIN